MNQDLVVSLSLLGICVFFFVLNKPRMDIVALVALLALPLLGIIDLKEAFSGFSDPSVILIALMFVVGEGLVRTGISTDAGNWILQKSGNNPKKLIIFLMLAVALIGSVMSSTGIVALFIPVVLGISNKLKIAPAKLMMPLSFAGLISGMMSLVATPPNMIVNSVLMRENYAGLSFFAFTPIGLLVLAAGIGYMLYARRFLGKDEKSVATNRAGEEETDFTQLAARYNLTWRDAVLVLTPQSPFCGKKIRELPLRHEHGASIVCIERRRGLNRQFVPAEADTELLANDALLIDFARDVEVEEAKQIAALYRLEYLPLDGHRLVRAERVFGLIEISVMPDSSIAGLSVAESNFRTRYGMSVIGIRRNNVALSEDILHEPLKVGDTLLLVGPWKAVGGLQMHRKNFIVLNVPVEFQAAVAAPGRAPLALISLAVMVGLMIFSDVPNALAALVGCLMLIGFKCLDIDHAYRSINWSSLILIIGMIPFASALEKTGGVEHAVGGLMHVFGDGSPRMILAALMAFTMIVGLFMSNTVTAVLLAPIAVNVAKMLEISPYPFAIGIAIAASTAFMTPISSPVNTLVLGPGRYRFFDFVRIGVPFSLIVLIIGIIFIPIFFPF